MLQQFILFCVHFVWINFLQCRYGWKKFIFTFQLSCISMIRYFYFKVIFYEIGTLLTTSWSDTKVSKFFLPQLLNHRSQFSTVSAELFFVVKFSEVILYKLVYCSAFNQSINVEGESFVKIKAILMLFVTRLGKNLISIATIFELKYYTGNFGTTSFPENKG